MNCKANEISYVEIVEITNCPCAAESVQLTLVRNGSLRSMFRCECM
jgi:GTP cyclohydrolase FolE2